MLTDDDKRWITELLDAKLALDARLRALEAQAVATTLQIAALNARMKTLEEKK